MIPLLRGCRNIVSIFSPHTAPNSIELTIAQTHYILCGVSNTSQTPHNTALMEFDYLNTLKYETFIINELQNTHNDKNGKIRVQCAVENAILLFYLHLNHISSQHRHWSHPRRLGICLAILAWYWSGHPTPQSSCEASHEHSDSRQPSSLLACMPSRS